VLGGYTTFSTYAQETPGPFEAHDLGIAAVYAGTLIGHRI
jgi:fluoride ion exporter CrcB/FEX